MAEENDTAGRLVWFVAGAAIGAAVALLLTPYSGRKMRRKISETAEEGYNVVLDKGKDLIDRGRELYEKGRKIADEAAELFDRGRKLVQEG